MAYNKQTITGYLERSNPNNGGVVTAESVAVTYSTDTGKMTETLADRLTSITNSLKYSDEKTLKEELSALVTEFGELDATKINYTDSEGTTRTVAVVLTTLLANGGSGVTDAANISYTPEGGTATTIKAYLDSLNLTKSSLTQALQFAKSALSYSTLASNAYENASALVTELSTAKDDAVDELDNKKKDILAALETQTAKIDATQTNAEKLAAAFEADETSSSPAKFAIIGQSAYDAKVTDGTINTDDESKIYFVFDDSDEESTYVNVTLSVSNAAYGYVIGSGTYDTTENDGKVTIMASPADGYDFKGWYLSDDTNKTIKSTSATWVISLSEDVAYTALFEKSKTYYQVTVAVSDYKGGSVYIVDADDSTNKSTFSKRVASGTQVNLTATVNTDYTFTGWTKNNDSTTVSTNLTMSATISADTAYIAHYVKSDQLNVNVVAKLDEVTSTEGGTVTGSGIYTYNSEATLSASVSNSDWYSFSNWKTSGGTIISTSDTVTYTITEAQEIIGNFTQLVDFKVNPEGDDVNTITLSSVSATASETTKTIKYTGYAYSKSSGDLVGTYNYTQEVTFDANTTTESINRTGSFTWKENTINWIIVQAGIPTYGITITESENGTVTADLSTAKKDDTVTLTITPSENYELDTITCTSASSTAVELTVVDATTQTFTMPAEAVTVAATFKAISTEE